METPFAFASSLHPEAVLPWQDAPFFDHTLALFQCVRTHDLATLSTLCDDDFGIIDLGPEGESIVVNTREEWVGWFTRLFATLDALQAQTDTQVLEYNALESGTMGYSVVRFLQALEMHGKVALFECITTIIWKQVEGRWVESRWHASLLKKTVPEGFGVA